MTKCVKTCEANEVFVPKHNFDIAGYNNADYEPLVCKSSCPTTIVNTNTVVPKFAIKNKYKTSRPSTSTSISDFYDQSVNYCTPDCLAAGTTYTTYFESNSKFVCNTACPPVETDSAAGLFVSGTSNKLYYYQDENTADSVS
jgi:hypothetical protein